MGGFANAIVGGAAALIRSALKSPNYVPGTAGWSVNKDGSAEFANLTLRGTFKGTNWILNTSGLFLYSGLPGAANPPVASMVPPGVTADPFGSPVSSILELGSQTAGNPFTVLDQFGNIKLFASSGAAIIQQAPAYEAVFIYKELFGPQGPLLVSLAGKAGTDPNTGTAFPAGLLVTAGVIQGTQIIASGASGEILVYSGTPAAGNLIGSTSGAAGTDSFGNNFVQGQATYSSSLATALTAGVLTVYSGSLALGWTAKSTISGNGFGDLVIQAASGRQVITSNNILDNGTGGGTFQGDVSVNGVNLNIGSGVNAKINLNPVMAQPPNAAAVAAGTATLAQTESFCSALYTSLKNRGMFA